MTRENYESCMYLKKGHPVHSAHCTHPERNAWSGMGDCNGCTSCPLDCAQMPGCPDECPYGRQRGTNELGDAK